GPAQEQRMAIVDTVIEAHSGEMTLQGLLRHVVQSGKQRIGEYDGAGANLVVPFVVAKKEQLVFCNGTTHAEAVLPAHKEGIGIKGIPPQRRIRRHIVIPKEKEATSVKLIGARPRDDVDGARRDGSRGKVEVEGADLELLDGLGRKVLRSAARDAVVHPRPVDIDRGHGLRRSGDADLKKVIGISGSGSGSVAHRNARLESGDGEEASAAECK